LSPSTILPIQYLRAVAALMVVWAHAAGQQPWIKPLLPFKFGLLGVDLFFVISGFIIVVTGWNATPAQFIRRRIIRLVPLYWLLTLALLLVAWIAPHLLRSTQPGVGHVVQSLLFIPHENPGHPGRFWPLLVPGWTLNYEMFFYAVFALALAIGRHWALIVLSGLVAARAWFGPFANPYVDFYTQPLLFAFIVGGVLGRIWLARGAAPVLASLWLFGAGVALVVLDHDIYSRTLGFGLLLYGCLAWRWENRLLYELGDTSYSLYLTHVFTLGVVRVIWGRLGFEGWGPAVVYMAFALAASAGTAWLVYRFVEVPLLAALKRSTATTPFSLPSPTMASATSQF